MKEDIEIKSLKSTSELIKKNYTFGKSAMKDLARDIDKILYKLEQLEEENNKFRDGEIVTGKLMAKTRKHIFNDLKDYIHKSKVKEKIEELKKQRKQLMYKTYLRREDMLNDDREIASEIAVLEELIKEN